VRIMWLFACAALVGSSGECCSGGSRPDSAPAVQTSSAVGPRAGHLRSPSDDELILQSYPWGHYRSFPAAIRSLLRNADIEHSRCAGIPGNFRACHRMDRIERQLERRGWCWGSEHLMATEAESHWLRCSNDPHYRRGNSAR
jgi:hypothetical protein